MKLNNINIVLCEKVVFGDIVFDNTITSIIEKGSYKEGYPILTPGFIDVHIHGSASYDVMDATPLALETIALSLVKEGTTSFLPTSMTQSHEAIVASLQAFHTYYKTQNSNAARALGIHLEGPYINKEARGAQILEHIRKPTIEEFESFNKASGQLIKKVSLAPEIEGATELIRYLNSKGIVASIAHTKASYFHVLKAIEAGATSLTHTYNAMTPLHHRDVGVVGAGFLHDELSCELIYDEIHVSPLAAKLLIKNKGANNVILITDSMRNKWMPDGISELGGQKVIVKNNEARLENGSLAGSVLKMIDGYKNLVKLGISLVDAAKISSTNAAKELGLTSMGQIKEGFVSDLVLMDSSYCIMKTFINGKEAYSV